MNIDSNAVLKGALRQTNVEPEKDDVDLYGLLPKQLEAKHKGDKADFLIGQLPFAPSAKTVFEADPLDLAKDQALDEAESRAFPKFLDPATLAFKVGKFTLQCNFFNIKEGEEIRHSLVRASAYGATMEMAKEALPEQFIQDKTGEFYDSKLLKASGGRTEMLRGTELLVRNLNKRQDATAVREAFIDACRDGQRAALESGAKDPSELAVMLRRKPDVLKRYTEDPAFRVGFDSARWALEHGKADELRNKLNLIERPMLAFAG